ncbi:hypothetical protein EV182_006969, partial [Spiromyces aspiralis]
MSGYDVNRLLADDILQGPGVPAGSLDILSGLDLSAAPGFVAEPFIKPPIDIDFSF